MEVVNDNGCSWVNDLSLRNNIVTLSSDLDCEWLIIGAGYTGLSAARKLANNSNSSKILIVDSQLAGEGSSARNSGYLVDTTLNDGFASNKNIEDILNDAFENIRIIVLEVLKNDALGNE